MAERTHNHGLNTYEKGETDWTHSPDMEALERRVAVRDVEANLANYVPYAGAKFEATDTEAVFYGTGEDWERASAAGRNQQLETVTVNSTATQALSIEGWRVIDVSNHGFPGDGSGGDLGEFVAEHAGEVAFYLPEGTYRWERPVHFTGGGGEFEEPIPDRFAMVGKPQATIDVHIPSSYCDCDRLVFRFGTSSDGVRELQLANLHFDVGDSDPDRDAGIMRTYVEERMEAENLSLTGRHRLNADGSSNGDRHTYKVDVVDEEGVAVHRNIDLTAGDVHYASQESVGHAIPFSSEPPHVGTNYWLDCKVAGFTDNGYYVRDGTGANVLRGCYARNCGGGLFRIGKNDSVERCRAVVDGTEEPADGTALWIQDGEATSVDGMVIDAPALANDAIRVTETVQSASIRNVQAYIGTREYGIKATSTCENMTFEDITIETEADGYTRLGTIYARQDNTTFRNVTVINEPNGSRNGQSAVVVAGENLRFHDCRFVNEKEYALRLGAISSSGQTVSARFHDCVFESTGSPVALADYYSSPTCEQLVIKDSNVDDAYGEQLLNGGSLTDWTVGTVYDNLGLQNERV